MSGAPWRLPGRRLPVAQAELEAALIGLIWHLGSLGLCRPDDLALAAACMHRDARLRLLRTVEDLVRADLDPPEAGAWLQDLATRLRGGPVEAHGRG